MENNRTLVQIMNDHFVMGELLNEVAGELDVTTEQWLEENKANLSKKIDGYKSAMDILEAAEEHLKTKAKPFTEAARACSNKRDALKDRLKWAMKTLEQTSIEGQDWVFTLHNGASKLVIESEESIPGRYFDEVTTFVLNKDLLKRDLEAGVQVKGAYLETIQALKIKVNATTVKAKKISTKGSKNE